MMENVFARFSFLFCLSLYIAFFSFIFLIFFPQSKHILKFHIEMPLEINEQDIWSILNIQHYCFALFHSPFRKAVVINCYKLLDVHILSMHFSCKMRMLHHSMLRAAILSVIVGSPIIR